MSIEIFWVLISVTTWFCHCNYFLSSKTTSKFGLFQLILSLSCSLWIHLITGMHILTSILNLYRHLSDIVPPILMVYYYIFLPFSFHIDLIIKEGFIHIEQHFKCSYNADHLTSPHLYPCLDNSCVNLYISNWSTIF